LCKLTAAETEKSAEKGQRVMFKRLANVAILLATLFFLSSPDRTYAINLGLADGNYNVTLNITNVPNTPNIIGTMTITGGNVSRWRFVIDTNVFPGTNIRQPGTCFLIGQLQDECALESIGPNGTHPRLFLALDAGIRNWFYVPTAGPGGGPGIAKYIGTWQAITVQQNFYQSFQSLVNVFSPFQPLVPIDPQKLIVNQQAIDDALSGARQVPGSTSNVQVTFEDAIQVLGYLVCLQSFGFTCLTVIVDFVEPEAGDILTVGLCLAFRTDVLDCLSTVVVVSKILVAQIKEFKINPTFRSFEFDLSVIVEQAIFDTLHVGDRWPSDLSLLGLNPAFSIFEISSLTDTPEGGVVGLRVEGVGEVPLLVNIDIKPGSFPNSINPKSKGVTPVAILTTNSLDATTVDPISAKFGPSGALEVHGRGHVEDVDGDGKPDLVLHFNTRDAGIKCGDISAGLTGETFDGEVIQGSDSIATVGCK
jgi:hypothetical protein